MAAFYSRYPAVTVSIPAGGATAANQVLEIAQLTGIHSDTTSLDGKTVHVDTGAVVVASSALPTGAATAAKQDTGNTSLASIDSKLTNPLPVSAALLPLPTGASTAANQTTGNASLSSIDSKLTSPLTVTGPLTDTQLRATPVPVSGTVTANAGSGTFATSASQSGTWNITNISGTVSLPTGASTSALQTSGNASLASIDTKTPALGQTAMAASTPVALASDQTPFSDRTAAGSLVNTNDTVTVSCKGCGTVSLQLTGTWTGTVTFEGTVDGTNFFTVLAAPRDNSSSASAVSTSSNTIRAVWAAGLASFRVRFSTASSGTVVATLIASPGSSLVQINSVAAANTLVGAVQNGTWTVQPGNTANTTAWKVDGSAVTQPVSLAAAISTKSPVNTNGSIVNTSLTATTASTASVPSNAVGFVLEAPSTNTDNIRWAIGGTASTTVGMLTEPGRDSGFIPCAANISVCSTVSGTNAFSIQWILSV